MHAGRQILDRQIGMEVALGAEFSIQGNDGVAAGVSEAAQHRGHADLNPAGVEGRKDMHEMALGQSLGVPLEADVLPDG